MFAVRDIRVYNMMYVMFNIFASDDGFDYILLYGLSKFYVWYNINASSRFKCYVYMNVQCLGDV